MKRSKQSTEQSTEQSKANVVNTFIVSENTDTKEVVKHDIIKIIVDKKDDDNTKKVRQLFVKMGLLKDEFGMVDFDDKLNADFKQWKNETDGTSLDVFIDFELARIDEGRERIIKMTKEISSFNQDTSLGRWDYLKSSTGLVAMDEYKKFLHATKSGAAWVGIGKYVPDDVEKLFDFLAKYGVFETLSRAKFYKGFTEYQDGQVLKIAKGKSNVFMNIINFTKEKLFDSHAELKPFSDSFGGSVTYEKYCKKRTDRITSHIAESIEKNLKNQALT